MTIINGSEDDVKRQREAMEERRLQAKQAKMAKVSHVSNLCVMLYPHSQISMLPPAFTTQHLKKTGNEPGNSMSKDGWLKSPSW